MKLVIWTIRISSALIPSVTGKLSQLNRVTTLSSSPGEPISRASQAQGKVPVSLSWSGETQQICNGLVSDHFQEYICLPAASTTATTLGLSAGAEEGAVPSRRDQMPCTEIQCWANILLNRMCQMNLFSVLPSQQMTVFHYDSSWWVSAPDNGADHSHVTALAGARPGCSSFWSGYWGSPAGHSSTCLCGFGEKPLIT